jgi:hypothetical protein
MTTEGRSVARVFVRWIVGAFVVATGFVVLASGAGAIDDMSPATGNAVATLSAACGGRSAGATVPFTITAQIVAGELKFDDPGGTTSGPIAADGTAHLTGSGQSYDVLSQSPDGRVLTMREMNGGCTYDTVATFPAGFPLLATATPSTTLEPTTTTTTTATPPASGAPSGTRNTTDSGSNLTWLWAVLIGGGVVFVGGGIALRARRAHDAEATDTTDDDDSLADDDDDDIVPMPVPVPVGNPGEEPPPPPKVAAVPPCECSGYLVISGRSTLRVCECLDLSWSLDLTDNRRPILRGDFPDGEMFCARRYGVRQVIAECTGGGSIPNADDLLLDRAGIVWEAAKGPGADELTLRCKAKLWVWCPDQEPREQEFRGELVIKLEKVKCQVSIVINEDAYWMGESGHTGLRIRCGEYDTIFGYYPKGLSTLAAIASISGDGKVVEYSSRDDTQADGVAGYYHDIVRREYVFDTTCTKCEALRKSWNDLEKNPGQFELYDHNCTTVAFSLVKDAVELPDKTVMGWYKALGGFASPGTLNRHLEAGGLKPVIHPEGSPFAPRDH